LRKNFQPGVQMEFDIVSRRHATEKERNFNRERRCQAGRLNCLHVGPVEISCGFLDCGMGEAIESSEVGEELVQKRF